MAFPSVTALAIQVIVGIIIIAPVLWLVGRGMVGGQKAKFSDAIWITALGVILGSVVGGYLHGIVGFILTLILWLALISHFFDCGLGKAFLIAIVSVIVFVLIATVLATLGIVALMGLAGRLPLPVV